MQAVNKSAPEMFSEMDNLKTKVTEYLTGPKRFDPYNPAPPKLLECVESIQNLRRSVFKTFEDVDDPLTTRHMKPAAMGQLNENKLNLLDKLIKEVILSTTMEE